ncbi:hypothetical protein AA0229_1720 [Gluconobacter cerinus NRIC 0229]|nr:hypothetical protein AA0229_1720 [Gluconobacter cerinus NRIC 0229]
MEPITNYNCAALKSRKNEVIQMVTAGCHMSQHLCPPGQLFFSEQQKVPDCLCARRSTRFARQNGFVP